MSCRSFINGETVAVVAYMYVFACMMLAFPTIAICRHPELRKIFLRLAFRKTEKIQVCTFFSRKIFSVAFLNFAMSRKIREVF
jgi:hypothetical protein